VQDQPVQRHMPKRAHCFRETLAHVRSIPSRRDVFRGRRVVERVPLAEKLGIGHLRSESVALEKQLENCFELPRRPRDRGALLSDTYARNGS
jgi:hypothetical protein